MSDEGRLSLIVFDLQNVWMAWIYAFDSHFVASVEVVTATSSKLYAVCRQRIVEFLRGYTTNFLLLALGVHIRDEVGLSVKSYGS